jgi:hypothetical protein
MYVPCSFERVFRRDRPEHFMVVGVDFHHQTVSLVAIDGDDRDVVEDIPFFELRPIDRLSLSTWGGMRDIWIRSLAVQTTDPGEVWECIIRHCWIMYP